jgi:hypothetical protein
VALGVLPIGPSLEAIELSVDGPIVEDEQGPLTAGRTAKVGEELFISCQLAAQGADAPGYVRFVFRVDGKVVRQLSVTVEAGTRITLGEYWTPGASGAHEIGCETQPGPRHVRTRTIKVVSRVPTPAIAAPPSPSGPAPKAATPPRPATSAPRAAAAAALPVSPATPAPMPATPPAPMAKPDLEISRATTIADPGCGPKEPRVTVRATVKNVGQVAFVPPRNSTLLEATVKIANETTLTGRTAVPRLAPGATAELEVVARSPGALPDAGGLRYSVVVAVNGESKVPEVTLDNNGEYVKAVFPGC